MKKVLLFLLFSGAVTAQEGFKANEGSIVWQRTYAVSNANVVALLDKHPDLKMVSFSGNVFNGEAERIHNTDINGSALMKNDCNFDFSITINPDNYVVKVTNLKVLERYGPMQARIIANPFEKYFMDGTVLRDDMKSLRDMNSMDNFLTSVFIIPAQETNTALTTNK